jgi:hypothetical protein
MWCSLVAKGLLGAARPPRLALAAAGALTARLWIGSSPLRPGFVWQPKSYLIP